MDANLLRERSGFTRQTVISELIKIYSSAEAIAGDVESLLDYFKGYYEETEVCLIICEVIRYYQDLAGANFSHENIGSDTLKFFLGLQEAVLTQNYARIEILIQNRPQEI